MNQTWVECSCCMCPREPCSALNFICYHIPNEIDHRSSEFMKIDKCMPDKICEANEAAIY